MKCSTFEIIYAFLSKYLLISRKVPKLNIYGNGKLKADFEGMNNN
jgi:hypothetical protein